MIPRLPSEFPPDQGIIPRSSRENFPVRPCDERANIPRRTGENPPGLARDLPGDVLQMSGGLYPDNPPDPFPPFRGIISRSPGDNPPIGGGSFPVWRGIDLGNFPWGCVHSGSSPAPAKHALSPLHRRALRRYPLHLQSQGQIPNQLQPSWAGSALLRNALSKERMCPARGLAATAEAPLLLTSLTRRRISRMPINDLKLRYSLSTYFLLVT